MNASGRLEPFFLYKSAVLQKFAAFLHSVRNHKKYILKELRVRYYWDYQHPSTHLR